MSVADFFDSINHHKCGDYEINFIIDDRYVWYGTISDEGWQRYQNYQIVQMFFTRSGTYTPMICLEIEYIA